MGKLKDEIVGTKAYNFSFRLTLKEVEQLDKGKSVEVDIRGKKYIVREKRGLKYENIRI